MKKITSLLLSFVLMFSVLGSTLQSYAAEKVSYNVTYYQSEARKMLNMINNFRASDDTWMIFRGKKTPFYEIYQIIPGCEGCSKEDIQRPLVYNYELEKYAMQRAAELACDPNDHSSPDGSSIFDCVEIYDSENIASGDKQLKSAKNAFSAFREDDFGSDYKGQTISSTQAHRLNMGHPNYKSVAFSCVEFGGDYYWVQAFSEELPNEEINKETEPFNGKTLFSCDVRDELVDKYYSVNNVTLYEKENKTLPAVKGEEYYGEILKTKSIKNYSVASNNNNAVVKNGKIVGKTAGTTVFTASGGDLPSGKTVKFKVTVKHKYKLIKHIKSTVKKEGKKIYKCECCGHKKTEKLPKLTKTPTNIKVKGGKKCYVLTWKKVKGAAGYEIKHREVGNPQKGCNGGCSGDKTRYKETYCLESGKTYNVQIQAYRIVNGKKVFSKWSKKYKVKIK